MQIDSDSKLTDTTDLSGFYNISNIPNGLHQIKADHSDYKIENENKSIDLTEDANINFWGSQ